LRQDPAPTLAALLATEQLPAEFQTTIDTVCRPLAARIGTLRHARTTPATVGLCGAQGSGKSTIAQVLRLLLEADGLVVVVLSIDDFYLPRATREHLARKIHPLLRTRGVPGTHDVPLAQAVLSSLRAGEPTLLPRFEKALDDSLPTTAWPLVTKPVDVILLEGWCVGAAPQPDTELPLPVNEIEREHDADLTWRRYVNDALRGGYQQLFRSIDWQVMLAAPTFEIVAKWRWEQEQKLRRHVEREKGDVARLMTEREVHDFVALYERLTRHMLAEMPQRANCLVRFDAGRHVLEISMD
jgi:D-glycerate 3-kinase